MTSSTDTATGVDGSVLHRLGRGRSGGYAGRDVVMVGRGRIRDYARVSGTTLVADALVDGQARVHDSLISGGANVTGSARVIAALVDGPCSIRECATITGPDTAVRGETHMSGTASVGPGTYVNGARLSGRAKVSRVRIIGPAVISLGAAVCAPVPPRFIPVAHRPHIYAAAFIESASDVFISPPLDGHGRSLVAYRTRAGREYTFGSDIIADPRAVLTRLGRSPLVAEVAERLQRWQLRR